MKSYHELVGERKALLSEARRADLPALRAYFLSQASAIDKRLAEFRKVGKPQGLRTVYSSRKVYWENLS